MLILISREPRDPQYYSKLGGKGKVAELDLVPYKMSDKNAEREFFVEMNGAPINKDETDWILAGDEKFEG